MKFLYLILKRIEAYFHNNVLLFCAFVVLSVCTVFILITAYVTSDPYIKAKQSEDITFKLMTAELFETDTSEEFNKLMNAAKAVEEIDSYMVKSFSLNNVRITAFSNNNCVNDIIGSSNAIYKGASSFTEKENSECAFIAIVGKDSELVPGDTAITPFGTFLIVGKNCSNRINMIVPYGTFMLITEGVPQIISIKYNINLSKEKEESLLKSWKEQLPGHPFGHSKYNNVLNESFNNLKIMFVIMIVAIVVMMMTLNYFDSQNNTGDIIMRLTGTSRFNLIFVSACTKAIVVLAMSALAFGIYDLLILCGVKEIAFFGKITSLEMRDYAILIVLCLASTLVTVIPMVIKNIVSNPFEIAQRRE